MQAELSSEWWSATLDCFARIPELHQIQFNTDRRR